MIGLSLAALVAGSLVTLAVLAQRVTLQGSAASPIVPRPPRTENSAPLVIGSGAATDPRPREEAAGEEPVDRVLPLRVEKAPAEPKPSPLGRPREPEAPTEPKHKDKGLPPGLARKGPRHASFHGGGAKAGVAPAAGRPQPSRSHTKAQGSCGAPPCGRALGHQIGRGHQIQRGQGHGGGRHRHRG